MIKVLIKELRIGTFILSCAAIACCLAAHQASAPAQPGQQARLQSRTKDDLAQGRFYYDNEDISDAAARAFGQVILRHINSPEAEEAQYYLSSYYHRKYYIYKERWGKADASALAKASEGYTKYINSYLKSGSGRWLSDARFNLAMVLLQQGNLIGAQDQLNKLVSADAARDPDVYVYQVVWSAKSEDVIDGELPARPLGEFARSSLHPSAEFNAVVAQIKQWSLSQRLYKK